MHLAIRRAERDEAEALADLHLRTALHAYAAIFPAEAPAPTLSELTQQWSRWLGPETSADRVVLVAEQDGAKAGVIVSGPDPAEVASGHLSRLYVDPPLWGRGIGRSLHDACLAHLADRGYRTATLWVLERNLRVRDWYERLGWLPTGNRKPVYAPASIDDVQYLVALTSR